MASWQRIKRALWEQMPAARAATSITLLCWAAVLSMVNPASPSPHISDIKTYTSSSVVPLMSAADAGRAIVRVDGRLELAQLAPAHRTEIARLIAKAAKTRTVNVIVGLKLTDPYTPEGQLSGRAAVERQRAAIAQARQALLASLRTTAATAYRTWDALPIVALRADAAALRLLAESLLTTTIQEDSLSTSFVPEQRPEITRLIDKAAETGTVNVIVGLKLQEPYTPEAQLPDRAAVERQRAAIAQARNALVASLRAAKATEYAKWGPLPSVALRVDVAALRLLAESSLITTIQEDGLSSPQ